LSVTEDVVIARDTDGSDVEFIEQGMDLSFYYRQALDS
jgi:hypothetical protein